MHKRYLFSVIALVFSAFLLFSGPLFGQNTSSQPPNGAPHKSEASDETLRSPVTLPPAVGLYQELQSVPDELRWSAPFARSLYEMTRRAGPDGVYDENARVQAFEQSREDMLRSPSPSEKSGGVRPLSNAWTNIGLTTYINNNDPNDDVFGAGCTTAIAIDPTDTNIMYVGGTSGGVWKSTNEGANWVSLTDTWIPNQSVASIAIDPRNHNTIYVGTGNGFASVDELIGTGLWKSEDGGGTWERIGSTTLTGTIVKVLVDPQHSNVILASSYTTNRGVYRSSDSGVTWTRVYTAIQPVWDIVAGTVYGGVPLFYFAEGNNPGGATAECGVYRSSTDGASWTKIVGNLPAGDSIGRCALAASLVHPDRVFVLMANPNGDIIAPARSLFETTNDGSTWIGQAIPTTVFDPSSQQAPQGWYDCVIAVSPASSSTADTVFIGGIEAYFNYDDGDGWQDYSSNNWSWGASHVDHHSFAFNPYHSHTVFDGCDGGLYWSTFAGWADTTSYRSSWSYRSSQITTNRFYHIGLDPTDTKMTLAGAQDQGTWELVDGTNSVLIGGGDGLQPLSYSGNPANPYYFELPLGDIYNSAGDYLSGNFSDGSAWDTPLKMAMEEIGGTEPYDILYTGRQHLWITSDAGNDWTQISPTFNDNIHSIGLSKANPNLLYVGTNGQISFTTNGGTTWTSETAGMSGMVTSIVTTNHNLSFALASFYTTSGHRVMRTTDQGSTWSDVSGTTNKLPAVGVNCVALDSLSPLTTWYAATDNGIYYTTDSGGSWTVAGAGIGLASCSDVEVQANRSTIRVATFGRGVWEGNTGALPVTLQSFTYQKQLNTNPIGTILNWITDSEDGTSYFEIDRSFNGAAFEPIAQVASKAPDGNSNTQLTYSYFDTTHAPGEYIYQLQEVDLDGSVQYSNEIELNWGVNGLIVSQNYPNPFVVGTPSTTPNNSNLILGTSGTPSITPWPTTRFHYELPAEDFVTLKIYSSTGVLVRTLLDNVDQQPGDPDVFWDGRDNGGTMLSSGTYFYVVQTAHYGTVVNKLILLSN